MEMEKILVCMCQSESHILAFALFQLCVEILQAKMLKTVRANIFTAKPTPASALLPAS